MGVSWLGTFQWVVFQVAASSSDVRSFFVPRPSMLMDSIRSGSCFQGVKSSSTWAAIMRGLYYNFNSLRFNNWQNQRLSYHHFKCFLCFKCFLNWRLLKWLLAYPMKLNGYNGRCLAKILNVSGFDSIGIIHHTGVCEQRTLLRRRTEDPWEDKLSEHQIRGWRGVSATG